MSLTQHSKSQSDASLYATRSSAYGAEDAELSKKADECVQYILFHYLSEKKSVVRRADINKNILKENSRSFKKMIEMCDRRLNDAFGLQLVDLDSNEKGEKYGIRSKFEFDYELNKTGYETTASSSPKLEVDEGSELHTKIKYDMLMISLALIFMNGNEMDSELFWDVLKRLSISREEKRHKYLGDVNKFFTTELVKEGYLEYEMVRGIDPPTYKFKFGSRSKLEITKKSVLDHVCQIYGGFDVCKPEEWVGQYEDARKSDDSIRNVARTNVEEGNESNNEDDEDENDHVVHRTQTRMSQVGSQRTQFSRR